MNRKSFAALAIILAFVLAGCGPRGFITIDTADPDVGAPVTLVVATSRAPVATAEVFSKRRAQTASFARFVVSTPPDRKEGAVTFPRRGPPDPRKDFVTRSALLLDGPDAFVAAIDAEADRTGVREAFVFVHGYNETFAESLYRQAQITHDFRVPGPSIHYAWPSAGDYEGYVYDKESVIFAAGGLAQALDLVASADVDRIVLAAHSMGGLLTMEALRLMALRDDAGAFAKIRVVVLMDPDVPIDLFRLRMDEIDRFDPTVIVFASSHDKALRSAERIQGGEPRLGQVTDPGLLAGLPVTLVNISDIRGGAIDHDTVMTSPTMIALIDGIGRLGPATLADVNADPNLIRSSVSRVQDVTDLVLRPPALR